MMQLSVSPLKAVGFAVAMAAASMANATTTDLGTLSPGYSNYFSVARLGTFEDFYNFSLAETVSFSEKRTITFTIDEAFNEVRSGFYNLSRALYDAATNTEIAWSSYVDHGQVYYYNNLGPGDYYLKVTGEGWQASEFVPDPRYNALINVTAAVPEPETYAMLLAGLGLIGTIVKRRSQGF